VHVGFGVSLKIGDDLVKPDAMLAVVAPLIKRKHIDVRRIGDVVRFSAAKADLLLELAGPLVEWWQQHGPQPHSRVALRIVGRYASETTYCRPDLAVMVIRNTIADVGGPFS
jgi:hypothetical protein